MRMFSMTLRGLQALTLVASAGALTVGCTGDDSAADDDGADTGGETPTTTVTPTTNTPDDGVDDGMDDDPDSGTAGTAGTADDDATAGTAADETATETGTPSMCETTPGEWEAPDWDDNVVEAMAIRGQLDDLAGGGAMRATEQGGTEIETLEDLTTLWEAGDPSLADVASTGYAPVIAAAFAEFIEVVDAGSNVSLIDGDNNWVPGNAGGIWGDSDRGINEGGHEVRQLIDKGGFGAGIMYAYATSLTEDDIDGASIDAIAAAWGDNAALDPDDDAGLTDAANYSYSMGFHADMVAALTDAKAYAGDEDCEAERDAALVTFFNLWEQTLFARTIFYGNRAEGKLLAAGTDSEFADVLHDLGEGIGVAAGFTGFPDPESGPLAGAGRIITDADLGLLTDALGVDLADLGNSTTGLFVESLPDLETAVETVEGIVMDVYGVDDAAIASYIEPTPG